MGILEEMAAAQQHEREREQRFARVAADFATLTRQDQVLLLAKLANMLEQIVEPVATPIRAPATNGVSSPQRSFRLPSPAVPSLTATALVRRVMSETATSIAINEITTRVLKFNPKCKKPEIYSAVYKAAKRSEFIKNADSTYSRNPAFQRNDGGDH